MLITLDSSLQSNSITATEIFEKILQEKMLIQIVNWILRIVLMNITVGQFWRRESDGVLMLVGNEEDVSERERAWRCLLSPVGLEPPSRSEVSPGSRERELYKWWDWHRLGAKCCRPRQEMVKLGSSGLITYGASLPALQSGLAAGHNKTPS